VARYRAGLRTESRIVAATRELLGEVGLEGTTLKAICDRAGVRAGSFYNLFGSKEEVVLRVIVEAIAAVDPDPAGETDTLEELVDAYVAFFVGESSLARIYVQIAVTGAVTDGGIGDRVLRGHHARVERFRAAMLRRYPSLSGDEATERTERLLATLNGLAFRWSLDTSFALADHARRALAEALPV
jgi:AcrR family transcriptional regulator